MSVGLTGKKKAAASLHRLSVREFVSPTVTRDRGTQQRPEEGQISTVTKKGHSVGQKPKTQNNNNPNR